MAKLIPSRNSCLSRMTGGEKRFSERLEQKLEDDYLIWYDVPIGLKQRQPDFVVFHPRRGLLVLEVKDWKADTVRHADRTQFTLVTDRGMTKVANPLLQARAYALEVGVVLERDPALRHPPGHRHEGKLVMPWAWGVVLSNISRKQFDEALLGEVIPSHLAICRDEMYETADVEAFQEQLWAMFQQVFPVALTLPQIDRVRWHLFPELRVEPGEGQFGLFAQSAGGESSLPVRIPDLIKVMDQQQEQLARSIGDEHRIIHGVAGSGKTMILGYRAVHLARTLGKPILVLCYNKTLAARLDQLMGERGLGDKVQVYNFHKWCRKMLTAYHVELPSRHDDFEGMIERVMAGVERGQIPRFQYGAVLIDEGHDFEPEWYRLIVQMVDPDTNSLLVLYDDAQNIYGKIDRPKFTWKSVGVQAQGRTTILRINYRNTMEILSVARRFAHELLDEHVGEEDGVPLIAPESAGRRGPIPELIRVERAADQLDAIIAQLREEHEQGRGYSDMAVIFRNMWEGEKLHEALKRAQIPSRLADSNGKSSLFLVEDSVKLVTMHSSKGLEFPLVIIPGLGSLPKPGKSEAEEARLLYVAMTRATDRLVLIHHEDSVFSARIRASINEVQQQLTQPALEQERVAF